MPTTMVSRVLLLCAIFGGIQYVCGYGGATNPSLMNKTPSVTGTSKVLPEALTDYVTSLMSDVNERVQQLERSRENDVKQMTLMQTEIEEIKAENINMKENMAAINDFIRKAGFNLDDMLSIKLQRPLNSDTNNEHVNNSLHLKPPSHANGQPLSNKITPERFRRVQTFQRRPSLRADSLVDNVAFHAILDHDLVNPGKGYGIVFGRVLTSIGGVYSTNTGTFTCSTPGTYVFSWTVTVASDHWTDTHLVRNGQVIGIIVAGNAYHYGSYTGTAVVHLDVGDEVFVKVDFHQENTTIYSTASTFSGFKIF